MIRKNLMKTLTVVMAAMLAVMTVACGATTTKDTETAVMQEASEEKGLENTIVNAATRAGGATSDSGKVETVYVTANANGEVGDVIVSEWLRNADASREIKDSTRLHDIVNVKGSETFTENSDGTVTWDAEGADIYYQGTTDRELPVNMKITYTLDGKEISPEELAGKSGRVTIRFDYENKDKQIVNVDGKDIEVYTPFAMVSGMMLDSDKFTNVEVSNGKVISDGGNTIVMGVAVPGLKESLDISDDKWEEFDSDGEIENKLSDHFEVTADVNDFSLGMTITMASSDILSDFGMSQATGSDKIENVKDDMGELKDGSTRLVDGSKALKDGTGDLVEGVDKLYDGSEQLADGAVTLYDGTKTLKDGTGELANGTSQLASGSKELANGTSQLASGSKELANGTSQLANGSKELADGTKQLSDGSKTLSAGSEAVYGGLIDYLKATEQIQQGAESVAKGAASAKAGSQKLVAGMDQADLVNNAAALATGSAQVSGGVNELVSKLSAMSGLMTKKQDISNKYAAFSLTQSFLEGTAECNETVVQTLAYLSEGKITDAATAIDIRDTGLAALQSSNTGSVSQEENGEELTIDAEYGVLTEEDAEPENQPEDEENNNADDKNNGEQPAGDEEGGNDGSQPAGDEEGGNDGSQPAGDEKGGNDGSQPAGADEDGKNDDGNNDKQSADDDENGNGGSGDENEQSQNRGGSEDGNSSETSDNTGSGASGSEASEGTITLTEEALDKMLKEAAAKGAAEAEKAIMAKVKEQTAAKTAETTVLMQKVSLYSGVYGAAKASTKILGETLETLNAVDFSDATLAQLQALQQGAAQVAEGNAKMAEGIKTIHTGAQQLDTGLGTLSEGANKLSDGTKALVANNDKLSSGTGSLVAGAKKLSDGADQVKTGAVKLSDGAGQVNAGAAKLSDGAGQVNEGAGKLADGAVKLDEGAVKLNSGAGELSDGAGKLSDGAGELKDGVAELKDGSVKLDDGMQELLDGMIKFDEEGISKLYDVFDGDLAEFADRITAIQEAGKDYTSFGGSAADVDSTVKFIIKTEGIKTL